MLIRGNSKLGGEIHHFSLPAGKTCPCQTTACASVCYAEDGYYNMNNVIDSLARRLKFTKRKDFVEKMVAAIGRDTVSIVRLHVSGDFYSAEYIRRWVEIVRRCPNVKFYTYTRSWRRQDLLDALKELAALDNVVLWWSADKITHAENGAPPAVATVRVAYMQMNDEDPVPAYADLVFRVEDTTVMRRVGTIRVCPVENGIKYAKGKKPTCSKCKLCYRKATNGQTQSPVVSTKRVRQSKRSLVGA